jgi:hypothetical protein
MVPPAKKRDKQLTCKVGEYAEGKKVAGANSLPAILAGVLLFRRESLLFWLARILLRCEDPVPSIGYDPGVFQGRITKIS